MQTPQDLWAARSRQLISLSPRLSFDAVLMIIALTVYLLCADSFSIGTVKRVLFIDSVLLIYASLTYVLWKAYLRTQSRNLRFYATFLFTGLQGLFFFTPSIFLLSFGLVAARTLPSVYSPIAMQISIILLALLEVFTMLALTLSTRSAALINWLKAVASDQTMRRISVGVMMILPLYNMTIILASRASRDAGALIMIGLSVLGTLIVLPFGLNRLCQAFIVWHYKLR